MLKLTVEASPYQSPKNSSLKTSHYPNRSISKFENISQVSLFSPKNQRDILESSTSYFNPKSAGASPRLTNMKMYTTMPALPKFPLSPKMKMNDSKGGESLFEGVGSRNSLASNNEKTRNLTETSKLDSLFRQDFGTVDNTRKHTNNDIDDVRRLDEWQSSLKRKQILGNIVNPDELLEQHKRREVIKDSERDDFPKVRQDLFNRIAADSDYEEEGKRYHKERLPAIISEAKGLLADGMDTNGGIPKNGAKSLDVMQRENNKEILSDLINKKIKEYVKSTNVSGMTEEQLRVHVRKIAEGVVAQFKTLKGPTGSFIVHNCVEATIQVLRTKRDDADRFFENLPRPNKMESEFVTDYEMIEDLLMEKFEICEQDTENLRQKVRDLTIECYNLKNDFVSYQTQLKEYEQRHENNISMVGDITKLSLRLQKKPSKSPIGRVENQIDVVALSKKIVEIKDKLAFKHQELHSRERELESIRGQMDYYKNQLRDLYYKCLKDDIALMKENKTKKSYAWVIRSLWRIKEEVRDHAFPSYLDPNSMKFLIDYAKAQNDLEEYCKEHRILNLISNAEDFKLLHKNLGSESQEENYEQNMWQEDNPELINMQRPHVRDLGAHLDDLQTKMATLKRVNLRAHRQVPVGRTVFKAKGVQYKWEEVDPTDMYRVITSQDQNASSIEALDSLKDKKKLGDQNKVIWEQGMDKLRAILASRKKEADRLVKQNLSKELDDRLKLNLQKTFLFLFGRLGQESFSRYIREKMTYDQNAQGKAKKANFSNSLLTGKSPSVTGGISGATSPLSASSASPTSVFRNTFGNSFNKGENGNPASSSMMSATMYSNKSEQQGPKTPIEGFVRTDLAMAASTVSQYKDSCLVLSKVQTEK